MSVAHEVSPVLLPALPAPAGQRRIAFAVSLLLLLMLLATAPFARVQWITLPVFVPIQKTLTLVADLITAALLFGQYSIERSRGLKILAAGYLFTALITIPHTLTFPGVFSESGLIAAGPQSAAWLYIAWHGGLPLATMAFALQRKGEVATVEPGNRVRASIWTAIIAATGAVAVVTLLVTAGHSWLPSLIEGGRLTNVSRAVVGALLLLPLSALLMLVRRPSVLDLWLMVVMFALLCTITVGALLSGGRFNVGWYMGLLSDALTSIFVLLMLVHEMIVLYARQSRAAAMERRERERRVNEMESVLIHLSRVSELGQNVSAIVHEVNQPLTAIQNYAAAGVQLAETAPERLRPVLQRMSEQAARATEIIRHLRDLIADEKSERRVENIEQVFRRAVGLALAGSDGSAPTIEIHSNSAASLAFIDRVQIEQVVFNVVRNAIEAMTDCPRRGVTLTTDLSSDNMIEVRVADTGPGLAPEIRAKLFQPFVTTKVSGLGVGLSICRVIIEAHGGKLDADDNPGGGTIFRFTIPRSPAAAVGVKGTHLKAGSSEHRHLAPPGERRDIKRRCTDRDADGAVPRAVCRRSLRGTRSSSHARAN